MTTCDCSYVENSYSWKLILHNLRSGRLSHQMGGHLEKYLHLNQFLYTHLKTQNQSSPAPCLIFTEQAVKMKNQEKKAILILCRTSFRIVFAS